MSNTTKHNLAQIAIAVVGAAAAAIASAYPNRADLVYSVAGIVIALLGGRAITHAATINAAGPPTGQQINVNAPNQGGTPS